MPATSSIAGLVALLCSISIAAGHEHHMDEIPEGEAVSAKPLVRAPKITYLLNLLAVPVLITSQC